MPLRRLTTRLLLAVSVPLILVTAMLLPVLHMHMETRIESLHTEARAVLKAGQEALTRDVNESLNSVLAIAEMPALRHYLATHNAPSLIEPRYSPNDLTQLSHFLDTIISHHPRYTKLVLIDSQGNEVLRAPQSLAPGAYISGRRHQDMDYFKEANRLLHRELYLSPLGRDLRYELFEGDIIPVVNVSTPVFDASGRRQGVVLLSLNWSYLTSALYQAMRLGHEGNLFLLNSQGQWLFDNAALPLGVAHFGDNLAALAPAYWKAMLHRSAGFAEVDNQLLYFQTEDIRTQRYRSLAGNIYSEHDYYPWKLGVLLPKPSWWSLIDEETMVLWVLLLTYAVAVAFGVLWAISSQRQQALRRAAQRHAIEVSDLYENAPCGYHSLDESGRVVKMNRTELAWLGYSADEVIQRMAYREFITPETRPQFDQAFRDVRQHRSGSAECSLLTRNGEQRHVMIQASAYHRSGRFIHSRATVFDLTERKQLEEKLREQAMTDPLTGVFNRRYLQAQAAVEIARSRRQHYDIALITIDIDHFKHINDEYGHDAGDDVLQAFTSIVIHLLRQEDLLCRVGGEEFAILLPSTPLAQATQVAERIRKTVQTTAFKVHEAQSERTLWLTASLGVTAVMADETSLKAALKRADIGLYRAKELGRNRVVVNDD